jgi:hypothetical protein
LLSSTGSVAGPASTLVAGPVAGAFTGTERDRSPGREETLRLLAR